MENPITPISWVTARGRDLPTQLRCVLEDSRILGGAIVIESVEWASGAVARVPADERAKMGVVVGSVSVPTEPLLLVELSLPQSDSLATAISTLHAVSQIQSYNELCPLGCQLEFALRIDSRRVMLARVGRAVVGDAMIVSTDRTRKTHMSNSGVLIGTFTDRLLAKIEEVCLPRAAGWRELMLEYLTQEFSCHFEDGDLITSDKLNQIVARLNHLETLMTVKRFEPPDGLLDTSRGNHS